MVRGEVELPVQKESLAAGDGAAISEEASLELLAKNETELLLFDLA